MTKNNDVGSTTIPNLSITANSLGSNIQLSSIINETKSPDNILTDKTFENSATSTLSQSNEGNNKNKNTHVGVLQPPQPIIIEKEVNEEAEEQQFEEAECISDDEYVYEELFDEINDNLLVFVDSIFETNFIQEKEKTILQDLITKGDNLIRAAYEVSESQEDTNFLAVLLRDIALNSVNQSKQMSNSAQDELIKFCHRLFCQGQLNKKQFIYLEHLILVRNPIIVKAYQTYENNRAKGPLNPSYEQNLIQNLVQIARNLDSQTVVSPNQQEASPQSQVSREDSEANFLEFFQQILKEWISTNSITELEANKLAELAKNSNLNILDALSLYRKNNDKKQLKDSLIKLVRIDKKSNDLQEVKVNPNSKRQFARFRPGSVPNKLQEIIIQLTIDGKLSVIHAQKIFELFKNQDILVQSAFLVYLTDGEDLDELLDTLLRILQAKEMQQTVVNQNNTESRHFVNISESLMEKKKEYFIVEKSLQFLFTEGCITSESMEAMLRFTRQGSSLIHEEVLNYEKHGDFPDFLESLEKLADIFAKYTNGKDIFELQELISCLVTSKKITLDTQSTLFSLIYSHDERILSAFSIYKEIQDINELIDTLVQLGNSESVQNGGNNNEEPGVIQMVDAVLSFGIFDDVTSSCLKLLVKQNDPRIFQAFDAYEEQRNIQELLATLRKLVEQENALQNEKTQQTTPVLNEKKQAYEKPVDEEKTETIEQKFAKISNQCNLTNEEIFTIRIAIKDQNSKITTAFENFSTDQNITNLSITLKEIAQGLIEEINVDDMNKRHQSNSRTRTIQPQKKQESEQEVKGNKKTKETVENKSVEPSPDISHSRRAVRNKQNIPPIQNAPTPEASKTFRERITSWIANEKLDFHQSKQLLSLFSKQDKALLAMISMYEGQDENTFLKHLKQLVK